ncbi:MAG TPA: hypothetical protein VMS99_01390 [Acidimicrobiia bacterium]|nr:hypothetical protein [Acidimicrobiia bacterium]
MVSSKIESSGSAVNIESPPDAISVSTRQLIRMGGFALFLGGVLWGLAEAAWGFLVLPSGDPSEYPQPIATILWVVLLAGFISIMLGLPALYVGQGQRGRRLGSIGFVVLFVGEALMVSFAGFGAFYQRGVAGLIVEAEGAGIAVEEPVMAVVGYLAAYLLHLLGWLLFGIAALRAQVLPRWPVVLAMVGPLLLIVGSASLSGAPPVLLVPLPLLGAVGVAWLGLALVGLEREGEIRMATTGQSS